MDVPLHRHEPADGADDEVVRGQAEQLASVLAWVLQLLGTGDIDGIVDLPDGVAREPGAATQQIVTHRARHADQPPERRE
ncbi:hypothetical protein D3C80_1643090 [compost metagenome]